MCQMPAMNESGLILQSYPRGQDDDLLCHSIEALLWGNCTIPARGIDKFFEVYAATSSRNNLRLKSPTKLRGSQKTPMLKTEFPVCPHRGMHRSNTKAENTTDKLLPSSGSHLPVDHCLAEHKRCDAPVFSVAKRGSRRSQGTSTCIGLALWPWVALTTTHDMAGFATLLVLHNRA
jgi:hypothetical protein